MFGFNLYTLIAFGVLLAGLLIVGKERYQQGVDDGWTLALHEFRSSYHQAYLDGFDDSCKLSRNEYDAGYDDGWWEGSNNSFQWEIERARADEAELLGLTADVIPASASQRSAYNQDELELAELIAAERLQRALA